jgi:hypothetical protein
VRGVPEGSFLTQDPLGLAGGVNLYAYAGNNPTNFRDPFGLKECPPDCPSENAGAEESIGQKAVNKVYQSTQSTAALNVAAGVTTAVEVVAAAVLGSTECTTSSGRKVCFGSVPAVGPPGEIGGGLRKAFGRGYPTKIGAGGELQPFDPSTGRYLSPSVNPGVVNSPIGHFVIGLGQGIASSQSSIEAPAPVSNAQSWGQVVGQFIGNIMGSR